MNSKDLVKICRINLKSSLGRYLAGGHQVSNLENDVGQKTRDKQGFCLHMPECFVIHSYQHEIR